MHKPLIDHTEPLNDDGSFREDVFYNTLGESYITIALQAAREADPNAKLYINEYNIEYTGQHVLCAFHSTRPSLSVTQARRPRPCRTS